jgi:hypothetical protein
VSRRHLFLCLVLPLAFFVLLLLGAPLHAQEADPQGSPASQVQEAQTSHRLELVSHTGGSVFAVALDGARLYFGVGPRLVIWDVADPAAPVLLGQTEMLRDIILGIDVQGDYAYLACERGGLRIVSVADPARPVEVGAFQIEGLPSEFYGVDVVGGIAYVTDRLRGLRVIDVSLPGQPAELGAFDTPGFAVDVAVVGQYAYVADESYKLQILDVSVASTPTPVEFDSYYPLGDVWAVTPAAGRLYVATDDGLDILSLADPIAPALLGSYAAQQAALDVAVYGDRAYLSADGLEVLDVSDPTHPSQVSSYATGQTSYQCPGTGGDSLKPCRGVAAAPAAPTGPVYVYVADHTYGLQVLADSGSGPVARVAGYEGVGRAQGVAVSGPFAVTSAWGRGVQIVNVADPTAPRVEGGFPFTGTVDAVAIHDRTVYVGEGWPGDYGLHVLSIADSAHPRRIGFTDSVDEPNHISLRDSYAYLTTGYEWSGFQIVDISDPTNPLEVGAVTSPDVLAGGYDVALAGDRAYVADGGAVRLMDVSDAHAPRLVHARYSDRLGDIYSVAADGHTVFFTDWSDLVVLDWTNATSPTVVADMGSAIGWGLDLALADKVAYVAADQYGLYAYDYADIEQITDLGHWRTPGLAMQLDYVDGLLYVALGDGGLAIYAPNAYAAGSVSPAGGTLASPDAQVRYTFPAGTFTATVAITHTALLPAQVPAPPGDRVLSDELFQVEAVFASDGAPAQPAGSYTMTISYDPAGLGVIREESLALMAWDGMDWQQVSTTPDSANHTLTATPSHFSYWAVMGRTERLWLPLVTHG